MFAMGKNYRDKIKSALDKGDHDAVLMILDKIEWKIGEALNELNVACLSDLSNIQDAYDILDELKEEVY